jgi:predicted nucleic acid-binding protein
MCIIVDANASHELVERRPSAIPVLNWLLDPRRKSGLIVGGHLLSELSKTRLRETLVELGRAGRLKKVSADSVAQEVARLTAQNRCKSNDVHVVALAKVTRCKVVYTHDRALHNDLRTNFRGASRVSVYQDETHAHLLTECKCN